VRRRGAHCIRARRSYEAFTYEAAYMMASVPTHALRHCTLTFRAGPYRSQVSIVGENPKIWYRKVKAYGRQNSPNSTFATEPSCFFDLLCEMLPFFCFVTSRVIIMWLSVIHMWGGLQLERWVHVDQVRRSNQGDCAKVRPLREERNESRQVSVPSVAVAADDVGLQPGPRLPRINRCVPCRPINVPRRRRRPAACGR
jgi:hypothetical protein